MNIPELGLNPEVEAKIRTWMGEEFDSATRDELQQLIDRGDKEELHVRFYTDLAFGTGGMPSSHSATMTATTLGIGLFSGFDHPTFALAVAAGATFKEAAVLANHAAGIVVGKVGTATVSRDELRQVI